MKEIQSYVFYRTKQKPKEKISKQIATELRDKELEMKERRDKQ